MVEKTSNLILALEYTNFLMRNLAPTWSFLDLAHFFGQKIS